MNIPATIYIGQSGNKDYENVLSGSYRDEKTGWFLEYDDSDGIHTVIGYSKKIASISRMEQPAYTLILEENIPYRTVLDTGVGTIDADVYPIKVRAKKDEQSLTLDIVYKLTLGGIFEAKHDMKIFCVFGTTNKDNPC